MKISLNWLKDFVAVPADLTPAALGLKITMATAEIEGWETVGDDTLFDIDNKSLTHRPDLWGHYGFAREVGAIFRQPLQPLILAELPSPAAQPDRLDVTVAETELCPRYCALVIDKVSVGPSPAWLKERLELLGDRSINNVVDITNYVLYEMGQPLHAFDRRKLKGDRIIVRRAVEGEKIRSLDGVERTLTADMLVIADAENPVAIAGVMGGADSEVDGATRTLVLESANFHPASIRRTSARLGLRSESSMRFEKGLDPVQTETAVQRFYSLLKVVCPQIEVISPLYDVDPVERSTPVIETTAAFINHKLGTALPQAEIIAILTSLHFLVATQGDELKVSVPSYRATGDIGIPEDLVEEVGRMFGYDNIEPVAPPIPIEPVRDEPHQQLLRRLRHTLSGMDFAEVYNYAFVGARLLEKTGFSHLEHLAMQNPLASDQHLLRRSLVPNMLRITAQNLRFRQNFRLYELERVFFPEKHFLPDFPATGSNQLTKEEIQTVSPNPMPEWEYERLSLCGLVCQKQGQGAPTVFYETKGALEALLAKLNWDEVAFRPVSNPERLPAWAHPGRGAVVEIAGSPCGLLAQLHPQVALNMGIEATVALFEVDITQMLALPRGGYRFRDISRYPSVPFDISLICPYKTLVSDVAGLIAGVDTERIKNIALFDVYTGANIGENNKSLAFTMTFAEQDHTLSPDEISHLQSAVIAVLEQAGYQVRKG